MEASFQIVTDQPEEVESDVNTAVAVAVATNISALIDIDTNEEEESPVSHSAISDTQHSVNQMSTSEVSVPDDVHLFLINFCDSISVCDVEKIRYYRESVYSSLTLKYYMKSRWPGVSTFEHLFENSGSNKELARLLYLELYYRHVFAKFPNHVKWQDRVSSWKNYITLFSYLLFKPSHQNDSRLIELPKTLVEYLEDNNLSTRFEKSADISLPPEMIHGIIDEFIYQFQDTCRYRTRISNVITNNEQPNNETRGAKVDQDVWRCDIILLILQSFVDLSDIRSLLLTDSSQSDNMRSLSSTTTNFPILLQLGYFSLHGLLRLHTLLGNYYTAIEISNDIDNQLFRALMWKSPAYISYLYYLGFSYLMLQRYIDAIRIFQQSTVNLSSNTVNSCNNMAQSSSPYQHDSIGKFVDRMSWLMLLCQSLSYGSNSNFIRMEESMSHQNDRSQTSFSHFGPEISNWKELFSKVSPRFVLPSVPVISKEQPIKSDQNEPQQRQMQTFSPLIQLYELTSMIRSFTKLYNNLNVDTLASLMQVAKKNGNLRSCDNKNQVNEANLDQNYFGISTLSQDNIEAQDPSGIARSQIIAIKSRSGRQRVWKSGENLLYGDLISLNGDTDLLLDVDTIRVTEGKQSDRFFGDVFTKQILKARNLLKHIELLTNRAPDVTSKKEKA